MRPPCPQDWPKGKRKGKRKRKVLIGDGPKASLYPLTDTKLVTGINDTSNFVMDSHPDGLKFDISACYCSELVDGEGRAIKYAKYLVFFLFTAGSVLALCQVGKLPECICTSTMHDDLASILSSF